MFPVYDCDRFPSKCILSEAFLGPLVILLKNKIRKQFWSVPSYFQGVLIIAIITVFAGKQMRFRRRMRKRTDRGHEKQFRRSEGLPAMTIAHNKQFPPFEPSDVPGKVTKRIIASV